MVGTCTVTPDTKAFDSAGATRAQQRGQRVIRGIITMSAAYVTSGDGDNCDLTNYFPRSGFDQTVKYRVHLNPVDNTGTYLGVYDHTNKTLKLFSSLGVEAGSGDYHLIIFSFIAIGE